MTLTCELTWKKPELKIVRSFVLLFIVYVKIIPFAQFIFFILFITKNSWFNVQYVLADISLKNYILMF